MRMRVISMPKVKQKKLTNQDSIFRNTFHLLEGDIVQIDPEADEVFGGCLMIVTEPKPWGAQGYITIPGEEGGLAFYRCEHAHMERVGHCVWIRDNEGE